MTDPLLDLIVGDAEPGSLAAGYLLASRGRSVGVIDVAPATGTTTVSLSAAGRIEPLRALMEAAPIVSRRSARVLQPEGMLGVEFTSERLSDAGSAVAVVDRAVICALLTSAIIEFAGRSIPANGSPVIDESGFVAGCRFPDGGFWPARCSLFGHHELEGVFGVPQIETDLPGVAIESEWILTIDEDLVASRFGLAPGRAAEWWLHGDPFDGSRGFGRLRAFGDIVTVAVVIPLEQVWARELGIDDLGARLRGHPMLAPLLVGGEIVDVAGRLLPLAAERSLPGFGDGWVAAPRATAGDLSPLTTELAMAHAVADAIDAALATPRVSAARLATLTRKLRPIAASARTLPLTPIDGWADELVTSPQGLVASARLLAERFASAG